MNGRSFLAPQGGLIVVEQGVLRELSIVSVGADRDGTTVSIAAKAALKGERIMSKEATTKTRPEAEAERIEKIEAAASVTLQTAQAQERVDRLKAFAIRNSVPVDEFEGLVLDEQRADLQAAYATPAIGVGKPAGMSAEPMQVLAAACLISAGQVDIAARAYPEGVLKTADALGAGGGSSLANIEEQLFGRPRSVQAAASTSHLVDALALAGTSIAVDSYQGTPTTFRAVCLRKSVTDFHEHKGVRPFLANGLYEEVGGPDGKVKHAVLDEDSYAYRAHQYGKQFGITDMQLTNDSIGAAMSLQLELGRNAAVTQDAKFWALVLSNPDSFFSAGNSNYKAGDDTALTIAGFSAAMRMLREQRDGDDKPISVQPGFLVVPPALEAEARGILSSTEIANTNPDVLHLTANPWRNAVKLLVEPRIGEAGGGSDLAWYLFATPQSVPAAIVAYLNGQDQPMIRRFDEGPDFLGTRFRCVLNFGFALADSRGAVKMKGEA